VQTCRLIVKRNWKASETINDIQDGGTTALDSHDHQRPTCLPASQEPATNFGVVQTCPLIAKRNWKASETINDIQDDTTALDSHDHQRPTCLHASQEPATNFGVVQLLIARFSIESVKQI
jgi:hypothetical protein